MGSLGLLSPAGPFSLAQVCVLGWELYMPKAQGTDTSFPTLVSSHCSGAHLALQKICWDAKQAEQFLKILTPLPDPHVSFQRNTTTTSCLNYQLSEETSVPKLPVTLLDGEGYPDVSDQCLPGRTLRKPWLVQVLLSPQWGDAGHHSGQHCRALQDSSFRCKMKHQRSDCLGSLKPPQLFFFPHEE